MSEPRLQRAPRLLNMRYYRRLEQRKQLSKARRVVSLVNARRGAIIFWVSAVALALVAAGAAGALLVRRWLG